MNEVDTFVQGSCSRGGGKHTRSVRPNSGIPSDSPRDWLLEGSKYAGLPRRECTCVGAFQTGGDERIRTADLCDANAALSQLSYVPDGYLVVAAQGVEPRTSRI